MKTMTTFNEHQFEKKLQYLKDSQESIQSLSSWCLQHRQHHKKIVSSWLRVMKKVKVEHRLTLFYLANDVIQYSKRKNYEFVESWGTALQRATPMVREDKVKHKIMRIFKIWNDRGVYDETFVSDLCGLLSTQTKKTQPEPALVETEFQSTVLFNLIRSCSELDNETDMRLRTLKESPISVCDVDGICTILKDRRQGDDMVVEVDEGIGKMQAYVDALQKEIKEREQLIEQLEQAQIYYSSQYGEAKIVCNAYRNFGNRVKQLKRKLDELIPSLKDVSPLPSPDVNAPSPSPDSDIDLPEERKGLLEEEEGFTPEGQPIKTVTQDDSHSLDNCFTSFLGNAASLPFDLQKNLFGESSPRLALTPSPIHNLLEESVDLPLLSLSSTSEGKPIEVINSRSKPDEGFSISDFFKNLSTNIPGLDVDGAGESQTPSIVSKEDSFSSLPSLMESLTSRYEYSSIVTPTTSMQMSDVASRYEYSAIISTPNTLPPLPPPPVTAMDSVSRYEYSPITTPAKQQYEYPPVVMTPAAPPPPPPAPDVTMARYDEYVPAVSTNTIQPTPSMPDVSVPRYDDYTPAITTPNVPPPPIKSNASRYDDYTPAITTPNIPPPPPPLKSSVQRYDEYTPAITTPPVPPPPVKSSAQRYDEYTPTITTTNVPPPQVKSSIPRYDEYAPAITTTNVPPGPIKSSISRYDDYSPSVTTSNIPPLPVKQYEAYSPAITTASTMQPPPPIPEMMESAVSRYEYPPTVTTPTPLQPPPLPPNLFPLDKYSHDNDEDAWASKKDVTASWSSKLPPKFPTWGDTPMETEWTPAMPVMPLELDTPESPPMYEKEGFSDPVEYDEAGGDVDHRTLVTLQLEDVDHRSLAHVGKKDIDHRPSGMRKKDVDHRNLISLTGSPLRDTPWTRTDQDYRTIPKPVAAVVPEGSGEREADRDYRVPRVLGQELHDNVESVDMELSDEEILEPAATRRETKPLVSFNISSPAKVLTNSPLHEKEETKHRAPFFPAQRIPTIGGNVRNFRSRGPVAGNNFTRPPPLPRGFRPAPLAPPPPPPPQFLNETDRFRTPPPQLHTPPPVIKHNAPNFANRSPVRNNFSSHSRNFASQPSLPGPSTPTKNPTLSYPNVKPLPQVKPLPSYGAKMPVSTASTPTQTERTLTHVKPQQSNSLAAVPNSTVTTTQSPQGMAKQAAQQNEKNSSDTLAETQQSQSPNQNSKIPQSPQNSKPPTSTLDSRVQALLESPQEAKQQQSQHNSGPPPLSQPVFSSRPLTTQQSSFPESSCKLSTFDESKNSSVPSSIQNTTKSPTFGSKQPETPASPVQNVTKESPPSVPSGTKTLTTLVSPIQNTTNSPTFGTKPPGAQTASVHNIAKQPHFGTRPPTLPTSSIQTSIKAQPFGNKPQAVPTSPVQNTIRPPPSGTKPPVTPLSPQQNITRPPFFGTKQSPMSTFVQNTRPPLLGNKPPGVPTSVQNTRPPFLGSKPPVVHNTIQPPPSGSKPPVIPASSVQNTTKPPPLDTKPPTIPSPVQNTLKPPPPLGAKSPITPPSGQSPTKPPLFEIKPITKLTSPEQNSTKQALTENKPPTTPTSSAQSPTNPPLFANKPPTTPTSSAQNPTKPPFFGNKPSTPTSSAQNTTKPPLLGMKPPGVSSTSVQGTTVSPPFGTKQLAQPAQSNAKPFFGNRQHTTPPYAASQNAVDKDSSNDKPPASTMPSRKVAAEPVVSNERAMVRKPADWYDVDPFDDASAHILDVNPMLSLFANENNMNMLASGHMLHMTLKREHEDEPWMNDDIPEFESQDVDLEPQPKVQGLNRPHRGRGRGMRYAQRRRSQQWRGPRRGGPPPMRHPYRPPPPPPPPPPLLALRPTRGPYRPVFRGRPRGHW